MNVQITINLDHDDLLRLKDKFEKFDNLHNINITVEEKDEPEEDVDDELPDEKEFSALINRLKNLIDDNQ